MYVYVCVYVCVGFLGIAFEPKSFNIIKAESCFKFVIDREAACV